VPRPSLNLLEEVTMQRANGHPTDEANLYYIHVPTALRPVAQEIEFLPVGQFLEEEPLCKAMWGIVTNSFKTRSKFLAIWQCVRFVAVHRRGEKLAGFLLVSTPLNWQIDYVAVADDMRGQGIASALVNETLNQAFARKVPYVMLTSREGLRPLYEGQCGFSVVGSSDLIPSPLAGEG
jgi:ribosomal protein S18 acetylase RimI-like enzyme